MKIDPLPWIAKFDDFRFILPTFLSVERLLKLDFQNLRRDLCGYFVMAVVQLQDRALFSIATNLFSREVPEIEVVDSWASLTEEVLKLVPIIYPHLPVSIERNILKTISLIGTELMNLSRALIDIYGIMNKNISPFPFDKIHWTSYFTINRMKTLCELNKEYVTADNVSYPSWIEKCWSKLSEGERLDAHAYFGKYSLYVFFHWICYSRHRYYLFHNATVYQRFGRRRDREFQISYLLSQHRDLYLNNTPIENVFRYSVIMSDLSSVARFFSLIPTENRKKNAYLMAIFIIKRHDSTEHVAVTKNEIVSTFLYLWQHVDHADKMDIVQTHFKKFFEFLISFPGTDPLIYSMTWYRPSTSRKANREFLEKAAAEISPNCREYDKHRRVFLLLFCKVEMMLCEIDVVALLEKLLSVKDIDSSVAMMKAMNVTKKKKILDVLHKIWQDLWKESIDVETFMTFFIEVQSEMLQEDAMHYN